MIPLSPAAPATPAPAAGPALESLDFLGRMPVPLRRQFKAGLDRAAAAAPGLAEPLACCFLSGAEWYAPFDRLAEARGEALPNMLVTTFHHDILHTPLLAYYAPRAARPPAPCHPAFAAAGLPDPEGVFRLFATVPFVFLMDERRLRGRPAPRSWQDLLDPCWADEIVFGGWRPNERSPYQDYNRFLLLNLQREFGRAGLRAFADNVKQLQHNARTAAQAGSNARSIGAIAVLPWLQAELCPRRERTRVVWPADGALAMPIVHLVRPEAETRVRALTDYVAGIGLGRVLARNCYPPSNPALAHALPEGARLKWLGWDYVRGHDIAAESRCAADSFFAAWYARNPLEACACS